MSGLFIATRRAEHDGSREVVVAGTLMRSWAGVQIAPGYGSAEERDATLDALMVPRRERLEAAKAAARETGS